MEINKILNKDFVIIDLGSSSAENNAFLNKFSDQITHIELDALSTSDNSYSKYHKAIKIQKAIHASPGKRKFYERAFLPCSSFLEFKENMGTDFGMEDIIKTKNEFEFDCVTLGGILSEHNINRVDYLKTDLEGLDFEVIKSIEANLKNINVVQAETRFQPVYKGEGYFHEICGYMHQQGFEFINFGSKGEWKYKTANQKKYRDGRMMHADAIFFKKLDVNDKDYCSDLVKQILIAKALDLNSFSEFLLEQNEQIIPAGLFAELRKNISHTKGIDNMLNSFSRFLMSIKLLYKLKFVVRKIHTQMSIDKLPHSISH